MLSFWNCVFLLVFLPLCIVNSKEKSDEFYKSLSRRDFYGSDNFPDALHSINERIDISRMFRNSSLSSKKNYEFRDAHKHTKVMLNGSQCGKDFINFLAALAQEKVWAISMLDAFGKVGSGVTDGNIAWAGAYSFCLNIKVEPLDKIPSWKNFHTQYCWAVFHISVPLQGISGGLNNDTVNLPVPFKSAICVPDSCSEDQLYEIMKVTHYIPVISNFLNLSHIQCVQQDRKFWKDTPSFVAFVICCIFGTLLFLGTMFDIVCVRSGRGLLYKHVKDSDSQYSVANSANNLINTEIESEANDLNLIDGKENEVQCFSRNEPFGIVGEILLAFSININAGKILKLDAGDSHFKTLNGLRFFSLAWIILTHTFMLGCVNLDNLRVLLDVLQSLSFTILCGAMYAVDTFFVLSGFLLTYIYLKETTGNEGKMFWVAFYLHRIWRLTPCYLLVLFLFRATLSNYFSNGPFWPVLGFEESHCTENWWWNVLYINNFVAVKDMCMSYSWYLANEMQFYVLSPLILIPFGRRYIRTACLIAGGIILMSCIVVAVISFYHQLSANIGKLMSVDPDIYFKMFDLIYDKPYCRIGSYAMGMLCGYLVYSTKCAIKMKRIYVVIGWITAVIVMLGLVVVLYHNDLNQAESILYITFGRILWSLGICWILVACISGYGGIVNSFLSWPAWVPLGRLTYSAYLWHYIAIQAVFASSEVLLHFSYTTFIYYYLANMLFTYAGALVISLAFESPFFSIEKIVTRRLRH